MWWKGLNSVKTGSKRAKNTCLSIPNGPGSLLEKRVFDPFLTHFWSQNGPFSRHFGILHEPKPIATGSKWAKTTCLSIPNGLGSLLENRVFHPFLTHCWSQNGPFSRHFGIFHGPKRATTGSKRPKNTCLSIPSGLGTTLEKIILLAPGTHRWPPPCGVGWPALRLHQVTPGTGVYVSRWASLRGENHQKWGVAGWTRCPRNSFLSHVAQDTARSWFRGAGAHCAVFGAFWRLFGPFLGHIVELEGTKGPLVTRKVKLHVKCSSRLPSFGCFEPLLGLFWAKNGCFWPKTAQILGGLLPTWRPRPGPPPVSFWLKTWIWQGHHLGSGMAKVESSPRRWEGAMAQTEW